MGKMGSFSSKDLKKLQKELNKIQQNNVDAFIEECAKELAARLLRILIENTLPGNYPPSTGKKGGTLRRGWTSKTHEEAASGGESDAKAYANSLEIKQNGDTFVIEIVNPVEYASYVEYGHMTRNHKGWVPGKLVMTRAEADIQRIAPKVIEAKIKKYLEECFK